MHHHPAKGPLVLKNLDDYRVWPVKHRHWSFELVEDEDHNLWVYTGHVRHFWAAFPADKALKAVHHRHMLYDKRAKAHYLPVRAMRLELLKCRTEPVRTDILKFLDWFERNVSQVMAKKREVRHLDAQNERQAERASTTNGPLRPAARPIRADWFTRWRHWRQDRWGELTGFLKGQSNIVRSTLGMWVLSWIVLHGIAGALMPAGLDWTVSYRRVAWASAFMALLAVAATGLCYYTMTRCLLRIFREERHRILGLTWYLLTLAVPYTLVDIFVDAEMTDYWWTSLRGKVQPVQVYGDKDLGRLVLTGDMEFGSADALEAALSANPKYTLVQLESPGGYVVEGLRMERIVRQHKLDTVVMGKCASACTLVFVGGAARYLGPHAQMLFHRSGRRWQVVDDGWTATDYTMQQMWLSRGVEEGFTSRALQEPIFRLWQAPFADMLQSGYATALWADRKPGY